MNKKMRFFSTGIFLAGMAGVGIPTAFAAFIDVPITMTLRSSIDQNATQILNFGTIDLQPTSSTVILDASSGSGTPAADTGDSTIVTGGMEGVITVEADMAMTITVNYPNDGTVSIPTTPLAVTVDNIAALSEGGGGATISHTAGVDTDIAVGGEITFVGDETDGTYTSSMQVEILYN